MLSSRGAITTSVAMMECASGQNMSGGCVFLLSELEKVWVTLSVLLRQLLLSSESHPGRHVEIAYFGSFWTEPRVAYVDVHKRRYEVRVLCFGINDNFATRYGIDTTHIPRDNLHKSVGHAFRIHMADIVTVCSVPAQIAHVALKEFFLYIGEGLYRHRVFNLTFPGVATIIIKRERYMMTPDESLLNDLFALDSHKWSDSVRTACYAQLCALTNKNTHGNYSNGNHTVNNGTSTREEQNDTSFVPLMEEKIQLHAEEENAWQREQQLELENLEPSSARVHPCHALRAQSLPPPSSPHTDLSVQNDSLVNHREPEKQGNEHYQPHYRPNTNNYGSSSNKMRSCKQRVKNEHQVAKAFVSAAPSGRLFADIEQETRRRRNTEYYMNAAQLNDDRINNSYGISNWNDKSNIALNGQCQTGLNEFRNKQLSQRKHRVKHSKKENEQSTGNKHLTHESIYKLYENKKVCNDNNNNNNNKYTNGNKDTRVTTDIDSASDEPEIEKVEVICSNVVNNNKENSMELQTEVETKLEHSQSQSAHHRPLYNKNAELEEILRQEERFSRPISRHAYHDASSARDLIYHQSTECKQSKSYTTKNSNNNSSSRSSQDVQRSKNNNSRSNNTKNGNMNNKWNQEVCKQKESGRDAITCDSIVDSSISKLEHHGRKRFSAFLTSDVDHVAPLMKIREY